MKGTVPILTIFILVSQIIIGQNEAVKLIGLAETLYEKENIDSALIIYKSVLEKYPEDSLYPDAFFNAGHILWRLKKNDDAEKIFLKIMESDFSEKGNNDSSEELIHDPFIHYKNESSFLLADIYLDRKDYIKALKCITLAEKKYPYGSWCGNALFGNRIRLIVLYSKYYDGINQIDTAIAMLWPYIFNYGFGTDSEVIDQMKILLFRKYGSQQVRTEVKNAENTISVGTTNSKYKTGYIVLFGNTITLPFIKAKGADAYRKAYTSSYFYIQSF
jgi:tetratricopeptide (TPR) repeat protein